MIISKSNMQLASSRSYERTMVTNRTTKTGFGNSLSLAMSATRTSHNENESYLSYNPCANTFDKEEMPSETYNRTGFFNDFEKKSESIEASYRDISKKTYLSILDFLRLLKFRGMFEDNSYPESKTLDLTGSNVTETNVSDSNISGQVKTLRKPATWTVTNHVHYSYSEKEFTSFNTNGTVVTADGRELNINVEMSMSREYMEEFELEYTRSYDKMLTDPLVINLDSSPVSISDQTFCFDLNADGKEEVISYISSNSGYLALDKNNDGVINDGSELFGSKTGNGFGELAEYDSDGNGWIDENDDVYKNLKVWIKGPDGKDALLSLKEADVGAIYLGNSPTKFALTDDNNGLHGMVRRTGIFLHEDGQTGTIQQVDF